MKDESLVGVTDLVAGEKDPRNLMLVFSMLRVIMVEWDITDHAQTMFDSVYAYFPITFRPPPNDPYGITAQDLKDRLRACLASTGALAPHTFPNMLDRLDSTSTTVKRDCLQVLAACANNYDPDTMSQFAITLWDAIKFEVLQAQEPELAEEALVVLKSIAACLSKSPKALNHGPTSPLVQYLRPINKECLEHLQEPAGRQAKASGDILKAVASASLPAFEVVIKAMGPSLFTIYQSVQGLVQQRAVLEIANQCFEASIEVYGSWLSPSAKNPDGRENLVGDFKDKFVGLYSQALMGTVKEEVSFRLTAANGLLLITKMNSVLSDEEIGLFVQYFDDIVLKEESYGRDELKRKSMSALAEISRFKPVLISDIAFPTFMARLPDAEADASPGAYNPVLEGLAEISLERQLLDTLIRRLLNKLDLLFANNQSSSFPYTCAILGTILYVLTRYTTEHTATLEVYFDRIVVGLCRKATETTIGPLANENVLDLLGRIMNLLVRRGAPTDVQRTAAQVYTLFNESRKSDVGDPLFLLHEQPTRTILSTWLLAALPKNMTSPDSSQVQLHQTIENLISFAAISQKAPVVQSLLAQVALYVNKHAQTADIGFIEGTISQKLANLKDEPMGDTAKTDSDLRLLFNLFKALILRLSPRTNDYLTSMVDLLDYSQYPHAVSQKAAMGFATILAPEDILSKENGAQIRLLAPQRVFQTLTPLLSARFRASANPLEKENYLIALSGVLASVPSDIVMPELPTLLPLLLQSLDITDQTVKIATLETLAVVISNNPAALVDSGHVPALVRRLISVAAVKKTKFTKGTAVAGDAVAQQENAPKSRRLATRCLTLMPKYITATGSQASPLLALKREVLHGLVDILDDSKRDVRKEAVDARAAWLRGVDDINDEDD
jgi:DNA repair/transcription protein MET18/MMS19